MLIANIKHQRMEYIKPESFVIFINSWDTLLLLFYNYIKKLKV